MTFEEAILQKGLTTRDRLQQCQRLQEKMRSVGDPRSLASLLIERGYMTRQQVDETVREIERGGGRVPADTAPAPPPGVAQPVGAGSVSGSYGQPLGSGSVSGSYGQPAGAGSVAGRLPPLPQIPPPPPPRGPSGVLDPMQTALAPPPQARAPARPPHLKAPSLAPPPQQAAADPMQTLPAPPPGPRAAPPVDPMQTLPVGPPATRAPLRAPSLAAAPASEATIPLPGPGAPAPYDPRATVPFTASPRELDGQKTINEMPALDLKSAAEDTVSLGRKPLPLADAEETIGFGKPAPPQPAARAPLNPPPPASEEDTLPVGFQRPAAGPGSATKRAQLELPGYRIEKKLGEGAMGAVYRGHRVSDQQLVAIKILPPHLAKNPEYVARFTREAESARRLQHRNIVAGIDFGESAGHHFFVMEFVDGESLEAKLKREGAIPEPDAIRYAIDVASALECAAREGIVHRDLKPANILVTREGQVKVVDLGLAKQAGEDKGRPQLTRVGMIMGSPFYLSPEQAATQPLDTRTDLYGLGATLYHVVTGQVPFDGADPIDIIEQVISAPPPDARVRNPRLSEGIAAIVKKLMAKKPEGRYQTPTELREELEHLQKTGRLKGSGGGGLLGWLRGLFGGKR